MFVSAGTGGGVGEPVAAVQRYRRFRAFSEATPPVGSGYWRNPGKLRPSCDVGVFPQMSTNQGRGSSALLSSRAGRRQKSDWLIARPALLAQQGRGPRALLSADCGARSAVASRLVEQTRVRCQSPLSFDRRSTRLVVGQFRESGLASQMRAVGHGMTAARPVGGAVRAAGTEQRSSAWRSPTPARSGRTVIRPSFYRILRCLAAGFSAGGSDLSHSLVSGGTGGGKGELVARRSCGDAGALPTHRAGPSAEDVSCACLDTKSR
jgi:hypothetical protein